MINEEIPIMRMFNQLSSDIAIWRYGVISDRDDKFNYYYNKSFHTRLTKSVKTKLDVETRQPFIKICEEWTSSDSLDVQELSPYKLHISLTADSYASEGVYEAILAICCRYLSDETIQQMKMYDKAKVLSSTRCRDGDQVTLYIPQKLLTQQDGLKRLGDLCFDLDAMLTKKGVQPGTVSAAALPVGDSKFINFRQDVLLWDFKQNRKNGMHSYIDANNSALSEIAKVKEEMQKDPSSPYPALSKINFPSAKVSYLSANNTESISQPHALKPLFSNITYLAGAGVIIGLAVLSFIYSISDYAEEGAISEWLGDLCNNDWFKDHDKLKQSATASGVLLGSATTAVVGLIGAGVHTIRRKP